MRNTFFFQISCQLLASQKQVTSIRSPPPGRPRSGSPQSPPFLSYWQTAGGLPRVYATSLTEASTGATDTYPNKSISKSKRCSRECERHDVIGEKGYFRRGGQESWVAHQARQACQRKRATAAGGKPRARLGRPAECVRKQQKAKREAGERRKQPDSTGTQQASQPKSSGLYPQCGGCNRGLARSALHFFFPQRSPNCLAKCSLAEEAGGPLRKLQESRPLGDSGWDQDGSRRDGGRRPPGDLSAAAQPEGLSDEEWQSWQERREGGSDAKGITVKVTPRLCGEHALSALGSAHAGGKMSPDERTSPRGQVSRDPSLPGSLHPGSPQIQKVECLRTQRPIKSMPSTSTRNSVPSIAWHFTTSAVLSVN